VREFVNYEIHSGLVPVGGCFDVGPRQHDRPARHRFARQRSIMAMHDACVVLEFPARNELVGVDDHVLPAVVIGHVEVEHEDACLDCDDHSLQRCDFVALGADNRLRRQKKDNLRAKPDELVVGVDRNEWQRFERFAPQRVGDRRVFQHALLAPLAQTAQHG
jgi:hypothetical protein